MKPAVLVVVCIMLLGCATAQHHSALRTIRRSDPALATETTAAGFERRLAYLGATIEHRSGVRSATFLTPASPGYFPPRQARVVYTVTDDGMVQLQSAVIRSPMVVDHDARGSF